VDSHPDLSVSHLFVGGARSVPGVASSLLTTEIRYVVDGAPVAATSLEDPPGANSRRVTASRHWPGSLNSSSPATTQRQHR
jgi:hypothetical protein